MDFSLIIIGLLVGLLVGLTGVGGAALLTPILIMFGIHPTIAVGTDLFYNSITKIFGAYQHWRQKNVKVKIVLYFACGSVPGAVLAVNLVHWIERHYGMADEIIKRGLGLALILIPLITIVKSIMDSRHPKPNRIQQQSTEEKKKVIVTVGAILGFIVGLTSIGSGSLFALFMMYFFQLSGREIVGTDIAHAFILVSAAGIAHMSFGSVDYGVAAQLLTGSIPGVFAGSILSSRIPTVILRYTLLTILLISGIKLM